jgi:hypothetical protein
MRQATDTTTEPTIQANTATGIITRTQVLQSRLVQQHLWLPQLPQKRMRTVMSISITMAMTAATTPSQHAFTKPKGASLVRVDTA